MVRSEKGFADSQGLLVEALGLGIMSQLVVKCGQIAQASGHSEMFRAENFFVNSQSPSIEPLCLAVSSLIEMKTGEIVEDGSRV